MIVFECILNKFDNCSQIWNIKPRRNEIVAHNYVRHRRNLSSNSDKSVFEYIEETSK